MKAIALYSFMLIALIGCQFGVKQNNVYFGGEIINPKSDFVLLMQNEKVIDTLFLNKNHTFGKQIKNITAGLYSFKHGYEFQYIYFLLKDSVSIRLNTWDFDNTLVFDGKGAERNELLLAIFKRNEKSANGFYQSAALNQKQFIEKVDTTLSKHLSLFEDYKEFNSEDSDEFLHLVNGTINYPIYHLKELYPYWHRKISGDSTFTVLKDYYSFRKNINLNDSILSPYYAYQNLVSTYLYKQADETNNNKGFDDNFRTILLKSIAKEINIPRLKNQLLFNEIYLLAINDEAKLSKEQLDIFYSNSTDSKAKNRIKLLLEDKKKLSKGSLFPDFTVINPQNQEQSIAELINGKNTVLYFWSSDNSSKEFIQKRVVFLINKFPKINFIGIHTNKSKSNALINQYFINSTSAGNDLVRSNYPRTILINSNGKVHNSFTLLTSNTIEKQITELMR